MKFNYHPSIANSKLNFCYEFYRCFNPYLLIHKSRDRVYIEHRDISIFHAIIYTWGQLKYSMDEKYLKKKHDWLDFWTLQPGVGTICGACEICI